MFFYRNHGLFRFYDVRPDGTLARILLADSDTPRTGLHRRRRPRRGRPGRDVLLPGDGLFRYYNIPPNRHPRLNPPRRRRIHQDWTAITPSTSTVTAKTKCSSTRATACSATTTFRPPAA